MNKLKYINKDVPKDEVWIDVWRSITQTTDTHEEEGVRVKQLEKAFGLKNWKQSEPIKITFYIYKKKPSWIEVNGKRIEFTYDIIDRHAGVRYSLIFKRKGEIQSVIPVKESCYPKKQLIKFLLNELVNN